MDQVELDTQGAFPTQYQFPASHIRVEWRGGSRDSNDTPATDDSWAILDGSYCLNRKGKWEYESMPSSRTAAFLKRCRFPLIEALRRAAVPAAEQAAERARFQEAAKRLSQLPEGQAEDASDGNE